MAARLAVGNEKKEKFLRGFARAGLTAHGIVYCLMSLLSVMAALGFKKSGAGKSEAFKVIYGQPFGKGILFLIGVAMLGYVTLKFFQAFKDTRNKGSDWKALFQRFGMFWVGLVYLALSVTAFSLVFYSPGNGDDGKKQLLISKALQLPLGAWIVGIAGAGLIGAGIYQVWRGVTRSFMKHVDLHSSDFKETFRKIGVAGHVARGIVFGIIGFLIVKAAVLARPGEAGSTGGAIDFTKNNFGNWVMAAIALGLLAYGIFMFVRARHEKMSFR